MKCAIVVGHTPDAPGAVNEDADTSEFAFNNILAEVVQQRVHDVGVQILYRGRPNRYNALPVIVNEANPDFIISLHANAFDGEVSGTETLYCSISGNGRRLASVVQGHLNEALELPDRGVKGRTREDRGGHLLWSTYAPCVIAEPFFIDNDSDLQRASQRKCELARAYAAAIEEYAAAFQIG